MEVPADDISFVDFTNCMLKCAHYSTGRARGAVAVRPVPPQGALTCTSATASSITVAWQAQPHTDLYQIGILADNTTLGVPALALRAIETVPAAASERQEQRQQHTLSGLRAGASYALQLRSHDSAFPTAARGWRNATGPAVVCSTAAAAAAAAAAPAPRPGALSAPPSADPRAPPPTRPRRSLDAHTRLGARAASRFTTVYRVSDSKDEGYDVDYLTNHNSADLNGSVAFFSDGASDGALVFSRTPVTQYCVEHLDRPFAPYVSCGGPEASPRNNASDPTCICQVFADRMIALRGRAEMRATCGTTEVGRDGLLVADGCYPDAGGLMDGANATASAGTSPARCCNCSNLADRSDWSRWTEPTDAARFVGMQQVFLPYFYYQAPRDSYPGTQRFGTWYSTPKAGECTAGRALGEGGCTWRVRPRARVVWGRELLHRGWNATYVSHWPLHRVGVNTSAQCLHNAPVLQASFASMDGWVEADSACAAV
eukprot:g6342.t1